MIHLVRDILGELSQIGASAAFQEPFSSLAASSRSASLPVRHAAQSRAGVLAENSGTSRPLGSKVKPSRVPARLFTRRGSTPLKSTSRSTFMTLYMSM